MPATRASERVPGGRLQAFIELIRLPNLFTVPGDVLVGAALLGAPLLCPVTGASWVGAIQGGGTAEALAVLIWSVAVAAVCLYCAGLVLNDLHDLESDAENRPQRPLPSGRIGSGAAWAIVVAFLGIGAAIVLHVNMMATMCFAIIAGLILCYNWVVKDRALEASLCMGFCRGFSMLMGAMTMAAGWRLADMRPRWGTTLVGVLALTVYISLVTWLARRENEAHCPGRMAAAPAVVMAVGFCLCAGMIWADPDQPFTPGFGAALSLPVFAAGQTMAWRTIDGFWREQIAPARMQRAIGAMIGQLVFWQSALLLFSGHPFAGLLILAGWPLSKAIRRRVAAS